MKLPKNIPTTKDQRPKTKLVFLLYGFLALVIALTITFSFIALRPFIMNISGSLSNLLPKPKEPKVEYTFKEAPSRSGFKLLNENKRDGFKVLLGRSDNPKTPEARFEVKDSWLDFTLATNVGESEFKKVTSSDVIPSPDSVGIEGTLANASNKDKVLWSNVLPSTDITYQVTDKGLKEEVIIKDSSQAEKAIKEHERYEFPFYITTYNVVPRYDVNGKLSPVFMDSKTGEYRFHIEKPFLIDAKGERYDSLEYELKPLDVALIRSPLALLQGVTLRNLIGKVFAQEPTTGSRYLLSINLPRDWMTDKTRAYPVILDPTVTHNTSALFATTGAVFNRLADTGSGTSPTVESIYKELPADINTVGLWHMNEASGNVADSSGNGNTLTANNTPGTATGILNIARTF